MEIQIFPTKYFLEFSFVNCPGSCTWPPFMANLARWYYDLELFVPTIESMVYGSIFYKHDKGSLMLDNLMCYIYLQILFQQRNNFTFYLDFLSGWNRYTRGKMFHLFIKSVLTHLLNLFIFCFFTFINIHNYAARFENKATFLTIYTQGIPVMWCDLS